jgi:peroxiredoxin
MMATILYFLRRVWLGRDAWAMLGLLAISLSANVYQGLKAMSTQRAAPPTLAAGMRAPKLYAEEVGGAKVILDWASDTRPTLLYIFSPSCVWCQRNFANFDALSQARKSDFRIVGLSTSSEGLTKYVEEHQIEYAVYTNPDPVKNREFLNATPTTLLISPQGTVKEVWSGAYTGKMKDEVEAKLGVQLPGIVSTSGAPKAE